MNKTKELIEAIGKYPERELIFMYPNEGSDHSYTMGYPTKIIVDEYAIDDERVWFRNEDEGEMNDYYGDNIADDLFKKFPLTEDQDKVVDGNLEVFIDDMDWKECIAVYIHY